MTGKEKCRKMKKAREQIAAQYGIPGFEYKDCEYEGECEGHCPACDKETKALERLIKRKQENKDIENNTNIIMGVVLPEAEKFPTEKKKDDQIIIGKFDEELSQKRPTETHHPHDVLPGKIRMPIDTENNKRKEDENPTTRGLRNLFKNKNSPEKKEETKELGAIITPNNISDKRFPSDALGGMRKIDFREDAIKDESSNPKGIKNPDKNNKK